MEGRKLIYYLAKVAAKFHKVVVPGDQLRIEIKTIKLMTKLGFLDCKAFVGEDLAVEAEIGFGVKDAP